MEAKPGTETSRVNRFANRLIRAYLYHSPITEGKSRLLKTFQSIIRPREHQVQFQTKHGFRMQVSLENPEHARIYYYGEHDERYEIRHLLALLQAGDVLWDIGANIGFFSCLFAKLVGPSGTVIAFEPASHTRRALTRNAELNSFAHLAIHPFGIGNSDGSAFLWARQPTLCPGTASVLAEAPADSRAAESIQMKRIDSIASHLTQPFLVKIDVEGLQLEVLKGGEEFFFRVKPFLFAELAHPDQTVMLKIQQFVETLGYNIFEFGKHRLKPIHSVIVSRKRNLLLAHPASPDYSRIAARL